MALFSFTIILYGITFASCQPLAALFSNDFDIESAIPNEIKSPAEYNKPDSMPIISRTMIEADKGHLSRASISRALTNMRNVVKQMPSAMPEKRNINLLGYDYFLSNQEKSPYNLFPPMQQLPFKRALDQQQQQPIFL